jgi:hypothetical protein
VTPDRKVGELGLRLAAVAANGQRIGPAGSIGIRRQAATQRSVLTSPSSTPDASSQSGLDAGANLPHGGVYLGLSQSSITRSKDEPVGQALLGGRKR